MDENPYQSPRGMEDIPLGPVEDTIAYRLGKWFGKLVNRHERKVVAATSIAMLLFVWLVWHFLG